MTQPAQVAVDFLHELARDRPISDLRVRQIIRECEGIIRSVRSPSDAWGLYAVLAQAYWRQGKYERSLDTAQKALRLSPNERALLCSIGAANLALGRIRDAVDPLLKALDLARAPEDLAVILGNLAEAFWKLGDQAAALDAFQEARNLARDDVPVDHLFLANQAAEIGAYRDAFDRLSVFLSLRRGSTVDALSVLKANDLSDDEANIISGMSALRRIAQKSVESKTSALDLMSRAAPPAMGRSGVDAEAVFEETRRHRAAAVREALGSADDVQGQ
jgi:tetratricopeptide (TPR) repeat protein